MGKQEMTPWQPHEDIRIMQLIHQLGPRWSSIATHFPGRTAASVRNRFLRLDQGHKQREAGVITKNRCARCGLPKKGHICMMRFNEENQAVQALQPLQHASGQTFPADGESAEGGGGGGGLGAGRGSGVDNGSGHETAAEVELEVIDDMPDRLGEKPQELGKGMAGVIGKAGGDGEGAATADDASVQADWTWLANPSPASPSPLPALAPAPLAQPPLTPPSKPLGSWGSIELAN